MFSNSETTLRAMEAEATTGASVEIGHLRVTCNDAGRFFYRFAGWVITRDGALEKIDFIDNNLGAPIARASEVGVIASEPDNGDRF